MKFALMLRFDFVAQAVPHQCIAHTTVPSTAQPPWSDLATLVAIADFIPAGRALLNDSCLAASVIFEHASFWLADDF